jgi:hypothetical protein
MTEQYCLIAGNLTDGFALYGPFPSECAAAEVAVDLLLGDWCVMPIIPVETLQKAYT